MISIEKDLKKTILMAFASVFSGYVTARSLLPGVGFTLLAISWLVFCLPFYYQNKIISINKKNLDEISYSNILSS